jgi:hypothetical protein
MEQPRCDQCSADAESLLFWLLMAYMRNIESEKCSSKLIDAPQDARGLNQSTSDWHSDQARLCILLLSQCHDHADSALTAAKLKNT